MRDKVYKMTTVTATSSEGYDDAVRKGLAKAAETLRKLAWFEVQEFRGAVADDGDVLEFQARITVAFEVE